MKNVDYSKITITQLLNKYHLLDDKTKNILWHMNAGKISVYKIKKMYMFSEGLSEEQLAKEIFFLMQKCDLNNQNFDNELYVALSRVGHGSLVFCAGHSPKYNGIPDDHYGFGTEYSTILDIYNDGAIYDRDDYLRGSKK